MNENQKQIKNAHNLNNIRTDLDEGRMVELENVELLYVYSEETETTDEDGNKVVRPATPFGLANEYAYCEVPGQAGNRYGVLCPVSCKPYVEQHQAFPEDDPDDPLNVNKTLWFVNYEVVRKNLMLTRHEAARFRMDFDGECDIMRSIKKPVKVWDDVNKEWVFQRLGIFDVIKEASGGAAGMTAEHIGERKFPKGAKKGTRMKDLPLDYVVKGATPGGLGLRDNMILSMCKKELKRRNDEDKVVEEVTDPEPTATKQPIHYCVGTKVGGGDCGTIVGKDGDFCHQHKSQGVTADVQ